MDYVFNGMMQTRTGVVPMPRSGEKPLGGHAICPVGYNDAKKIVKFKNSWSSGWGEKGYGYLPYAYIEKYMMDAWSSVDIEDEHPLTIAQVMQSMNGAVAAWPMRAPRNSLNDPRSDHPRHSRPAGGPVIDPEYHPAQNGVASITGEWVNPLWSGTARADNDGRANLTTNDSQRHGSPCYEKG